jgi:hypothetical protein
MVTPINSSFRSKSNAFYLEKRPLINLLCLSDFIIVEFVKFIWNGLIKQNYKMSRRGHPGLVY